MFWPEQTELSGDEQSKIQNRKSKMLVIPPKVLARADRVIK